ncbi:MAG: xanthine dehydrogenase family protein molybdopterin-binding subunit [Actinomycetota bacterium]|nr:xanthine dehydrogenase family protein molybdopterin-binding subunit [Actinomycetota bacterium]
MATTLSPSIGAPAERVDARAKVTGAARYAFEQPVDNIAYGWIVQSTIARGTITSIDASGALKQPGVLAVLDHGSAGRTTPVRDGELSVLQSPEVHYRGQIVAAVIADSLEAAREGAALVTVGYDEEPHDVVLRADHPRLYTPEVVNPSFPATTEQGDVEKGLREADRVHDATYSTPAQHNNPMEPHATIAAWEGGALTLWESTQGAPAAQATFARVFGLDPAQCRVISQHVGGGFGSKGTPRPPAIVAALAARHVERPVKIAVTRQQMFAFVGYRTPTIQRLRLGATADGRLTAISHEATEQSSTVREFAEQTALATRTMYAAPNRFTTHRLARLDVPTPSWMRAPGECPGMFALESAIDELAVALAMDPIELRVRNEPAVDPTSGAAFSSRNLVACLREGAERFGWAGRDPAPAARLDGRWMVGTGVAASTYPAYQSPATAKVTARAGGGYLVEIGAADIGTGARTVLTQIAADALEVAAEQVHVELGDSSLPRAGLAGGSMGTASWGTAVSLACRKLREEGGAEAFADSTDFLGAREQFSRHAYGAQFAEVRVDPLTGEVRVSRMFGMFAAGRIINPRTARSQFLGGMTMGLGMALMEESVMDERFGDYLNHDLAGYHVACHADVEDMDAAWVDETDANLNPMGSKGIGEIGIVGTAAAIANAVFHATGARVRDLPIRLDRVLGA